MSRSRIAAAFLASVVLLLSQTGLANAAERPEGAVAISGTVSDPATGDPVSNAPVKITVTGNGWVPADDGVGNDSCEVLYPNPPVTTSTDGLGNFYIVVQAYPGSERCEFLIIGNAQLPSGEVAKGSQVVTGLFADARVPFNLPREGVRASAPPASAASDAASSADDSGSSNSKSAILLAIAIILGAIALFAFLIWLTVLVARAAQRKGRSFWAWFWIAFFFLIPAAIIVAIMGPKPEYPVVAATAPPVSTEPVKRCPYCGEEILAVAKKCKHCGEYLTTD